MSKTEIYQPINRKKVEQLDEILEKLETITKKTQKMLDETNHSVARRTEVYEKILRSKDSSEVQKLKASLERMFAYDRLERLSSQLSLLYILQMFAFKVNVLKISVDNINEKIVKSEKTKVIENTKKHIERLTILLEAQNEALKKIEENRKSYIS
jgi:hypothetical protein